MKKHRMEIAALTLLLGILCYAFYDCNIKGKDEAVVISNELLTMREIYNRKDITMELLTLPVLKEEVEETTEEETTEVAEEEIIESSENEIVIEEEQYVEEVPIANIDYVPDYNEDLASQIVDYALQFVGNPYVYGGNSLTEGTDCSGFTKLVFGNFAINLERVASSQVYNGVSVGLSNLMPGDIVLSGYDGNISHSSLYIGDGKLVHALNSNTGIVVTDLYIMPIIDVRRVI